MVPGKTTVVGGRIRVLHFIKNTPTSKFHLSYALQSAQSGTLKLNNPDLFFFWFTKIAPSSPPAIDAQETRAEDAHTIRVKWDEINKKDQNGIIQGYNVYCNEKGQRKGSRKQTTATNTIGLAGLKPFTEYCIKVTGYTKVGESPEGNCVFVKTLDSGKVHEQCITTISKSPIDSLKQVLVQKINVA